MPALTMQRAQDLETESFQASVREIAGYLQENLGQRMTGYLAGLNDPKQVGRWQSEGGPRPAPDHERRLREGYKVVRMLIEAYDAETARAWLFGTNTRLDDRAPIEVLRGASLGDPALTDVVRAARQAAAIR